MQNKFWLHREESLKFVQEYVKHKVLLMSGSKSETKIHKVMRNNALSQVSKEMNIPGFGPKEVYRKLRNIKSTYGQELKKMSTATARGSNYKTNLIWFKTLDTALKLFEEEKQSKIPLELSNVGLDVIQINDDSTDYQIKLEFFKEEDADTIVTEHNNVYPSKMSEDDMSKTLKKSEDCINEDINDDISRYDGPSSTVVPTNEFDVFGESIAAQLKNMPLEKALEAQMFIQSYLSSLRLKSLRGY